VAVTCRQDPSEIVLYFIAWTNIKRLSINTTMLVHTFLQARDSIVNRNPRDLTYMIAWEWRVGLVWVEPMKGQSGATSCACKRGSQATSFHYFYIEIQNSVIHVHIELFALIDQAPDPKRSLEMRFRSHSC
jgi:hypothetical protein